MISAIVAQANNRVIGKANELPWYLPADLRHFKEITVGHTVIMGRKTFDSIITRLGRPLPNRTNIVITRDKGFKAEDAKIVHSLKAAIQTAADGEMFVIGGAQIYEQALPYLDRIYLTQIKADIEGDTHFPELAQEEWWELSNEHHKKDDKNPYDYSFITLVRK